MRRWMLGALTVVVLLGPVGCDPTAVMDRSSDEPFVAQAVSGAEKPVPLPDVISPLPFDPPDYTSSPWAPPAETPLAPAPGPLGMKDGAPSLTVSPLAGAGWDITRAPHAVAS